MLVRLFRGMLSIDPSTCSHRGRSPICSKYALTATDLFSRRLQLSFLNAQATFPIKAAVLREVSNSRHIDVGQCLLHFLPVWSVVLEFTCEPYHQAILLGASLPDFLSLLLI